VWLEFVQVKNFPTNKSGDEETVDVGGLGTFSNKELGMEIIFWQILK
jgi:hypothetical protein